MIIERLKEARPEDMDRDAIEFFGLAPGDVITWNKDVLTVGDESVRIASVREALERREPPGIRIEDLQ
jgi:hypothetical protein